MDMITVQRRMGLPENHSIVRKAQELQRLSKVQFDAASFGIGDVCKAVLCYELACSVLQVPFDRQKGIKISGLSDKAYARSLTTFRNALGLRTNLDVRELAIQFGCVRLIQAVHRAIAAYKERFVAALPETRRGSADFGRPVFTAVAFYLCAKKYKLKVDRAKLLEVSNTSDTEFSNVATSMADMCFDILGTEKVKKDPKLTKCNRTLLDAIPGKREGDEDSESSYSSDLDDEQVVALCRKRSRTEDYDIWKESVVASRENKSSSSSSAVKKAKKQAQLNFTMAERVR